MKVLDFGIVKATDPWLIETGIQATSTMMLPTPSTLTAARAGAGRRRHRRPRRHLRRSVAWLLVVQTRQLVFTATSA